MPTLKNTFMLTLGGLAGFAAGAYLARGSRRLAPDGLSGELPEDWQDESSINRDGEGLMDGGQQPQPVQATDTRTGPGATITSLGGQPGFDQATPTAEEPFPEGRPYPLPTGPSPGG